MSNSLLLPAAEAAKLLGIGKTKFYALHASGRLPLPIRLGSKCARWSKLELEEWISCKCPPRHEWESRRGRP